MLRDPEQPDREEVEQNLDRPFYSPGKTLVEKRLYARNRCARIERIYQEHNDCTGDRYYTCIEVQRKE
ncbi:MAG TPA: hypothetical protein IGS17_02305 [Oscillatoriales cyanobacterium M59_W2019_021]|nr:hypothetical protein [Oscillatoriales cyanobacterium M4454_W2019_049]HIK49748.1 hypothetical protein [Oscillatoriales cyanobacterium M59_W2019_021]